MSKQEWDQRKSRPTLRSPSPAKRAAPKETRNKKGGGHYIDPARCCEEYLKNGRCNRTEENRECNKLHVTQAELDRENKQREKAAPPTKNIKA